MDLFNSATHGDTVIFENVNLFGVNLVVDAALNIVGYNSVLYREGNNIDGFVLTLKDTASGTNITGLKINGNLISGGIKTQDASNIKIENCDISNGSSGPNSGFGIDINGGNNITIKDNIIQYCNGHDGIMYWNSALRLASNPRNVLVEGNTIANNNWYGITCYGTNVTIRNNNITNNSQIYGTNVFLSTTNGFVDIYNNNITSAKEGPGLNNNPSGTGIAIDQNNMNTDIAIHNNNITDNGRHGISIHNSNYNSGKIKIYENNISNNNYSGVHSRLGSSDQASADIYDNEINNNKVYGIEGSLKHSTIKNNKIEGNTESGVYLTSASYNSTIENNTIKKSKNGVYVAGKQNKVKENTITKNQNGIYITGEENYISQNTINDNSDCGINVTGINNVINYNLIFNNTNYGMYSTGTNCSGDYNWWGANDVSNMTNFKLGNYFTMFLTSPMHMQNVTIGEICEIYYTFILNGTNDTISAKNLPYFVTKITYPNYEDYIDGRFSKTLTYMPKLASVDFQDVTATTHNELQKVSFFVMGIKEIDPSTNDTNKTNPPSDGTNKINPSTNGTNSINKNDNISSNINLSAKATMEKTGIPIIAILLILLTSLGLLARRK